MMKHLKDYWFLIVFLMASFAGYVEFRVRANTSTEVGNIQFVSPDQLAERVEKLNREIQANAERIANNKENADKLDNKIERIVDILLEE